MDETSIRFGFIGLVCGAALLLVGIVIGHILDPDMIIPEPAPFPEIPNYNEDLNTIKGFAQDFTIVKGFASDLNKIVTDANIIKYNQTELLKGIVAGNYWRSCMAQDKGFTNVSLGQGKTQTVHIWQMVCPLTQQELQGGN